MLKRFYSIIIIVIFFILTIPMITPIISQTATADAEYWTDWVIDNETTRTGETIIVHEDVIVKNGGSLTLDNCVLKIDSWIPGHNGIEVEAGGELYVYNSTITAYLEMELYTFEVYGDLEIENSDISCMFNLGIGLSDTKNVSIKNSRIHDNGPYAIGITVDNSTGTITGNDIYNNLVGIVSRGYASVEISGNNIKKNQRGISCRGGSRVFIKHNYLSENSLESIEVMENSVVDIANNTINSNYDGICCFDTAIVNVTGNVISKNSERGIDIEDNSVANVTNSNIIDSNKHGICCFANATVNIIDNIISKNSEQGIHAKCNAIVNIDNNIITSNSENGIVCLDNSKVNINNNTISDTYDVEGKGINVLDNSIVSIVNNIITSNKQNGIACFEDSKVNINSNTISDSYDAYGRGINIQDNSTVSIANNVIIKNMEIGIFCSDDSKVNINNNTISDTYGEHGRGINIQSNSIASIANNIITSNKEGISCSCFSTVCINNNDIILNRYGFVVLYFANVNIYNSSIINSAEYDIWVGESSHPTVINTIFSLDKLHFNDTESIISVGYWVDVNTYNKNNTSVQNAEITIENKDGTEVFNGSTDYNGHVSSIAVVEYDLDYTFAKKGYTPHNVYASKLGQSASEKITVDRDRVVNFTLDISNKLARGNLITQIVEGHEVSVEYSGNGTVSIEPAAKPAKIPNAIKDIGIFVNINAVGDVEDLYITIRYSDNELGKVNETNLRMYCYFEPGDFNPGDFNPGDFDLLNPGNFTGGWVKIKNSGVDIYNNVVWASVDHLTIFAPMAEEIAKPVSKGNVWLLYGIAAITSFAILFVAYIFLRKRIFRQSGIGK